MPITKSAKKALRQSKKRRTGNIAKKAAVRNIRKIIITEPSPANLRSAYKAIDKAAKTNVFAKRKAARLKSRIAKRMKKTNP